MFLAVRYNDQYVLFHDRHKFIGAGHFDRQVPKNYFQACSSPPRLVAATQVWAPKWGHKTILVVAQIITYIFNNKRPKFVFKGTSLPCILVQSDTDLYFFRISPDDHSTEWVSDTWLPCFWLKCK